MEYEMSRDEKFDSIYRAYEDDVYRISLYYTKDEHVAREITQRTFFQYYLHMEQAKIEMVRSYLARTAKNLSLNHLRDIRYRQNQVELCAMEDSEPTTSSIEESYIEEEQKRRQRELTNSILERLREENELWYEAINLVCCLEKPQELVAKELGVSKDVLYSRLHRARRWIQKNYGEQFDDVVGK